MEETYTFKMTSAEAKSYQSQIDKCLQEIRGLRSILDADQVEIIQLREETRRNLDEIRRLIPHESWSPATAILK